MAEEKVKLFKQIGKAVQSIDWESAKDAVTNAASITGETLKTAGKTAAQFGVGTTAAAGDYVKTGAQKAVKLGEKTVQQAKEIDFNKIKPNFNMEDVLLTAMRTPGVRIDRAQFLYKELIKYFPEETVHIAIQNNPAFAGIERDVINNISEKSITYEASKCTALSFAAGLPGGGILNGVAISADIIQYFSFMLRIMQKLAYLYGFPEFHLSETEIDDETMNYLLLFFGVMFGVNGTNQAVKYVAQLAAKRTAKVVATKPLMKTALYPVIKKIAKTVGIRMTKQVFGKTVGDLIPILGGIVSGGLTMGTFLPCAHKLKNEFKQLNLSNPDYYQHPEKYHDDLIDPDQVLNQIITDFEKEDPISTEEFSE